MDTVMPFNKLLVLNGPSSAGKSSVAGELRQKLRSCGRDPAVFSIDNYMKISTDEEIWEDDVYEIMPDMCRDITPALQKGKWVIVDHVVTSARIWDALLGAAAGFGVVTVLVTCSLETLLKRERERGNRFSGTAEASFQYLYPREGYDLCLDSEKSSPAESAECIMDYLRREGLLLKTAPPLLFRAARRNVFGRLYPYGCGSITDALFVYLDGKPGPDSEAALESRFKGRPWVCLTDAWEEYIRDKFPDAAVYTRTVMAPSGRFCFPEEKPLFEGCRISLMDRDAFERHPFSHGANYASWDAFRSEGSGAVVSVNGEIVSSASSFLSLDGEVELDVSTKEGFRRKGLASACIARMLHDCMDRGIVVHWDAQNDASRRLAEKFGFGPEYTYTVYVVIE